MPRGCWRTSRAAGERKKQSPDARATISTAPKSPARRCAQPASAPPIWGTGTPGVSSCPNDRRAHHRDTTRCPKASPRAATHVLGSRPAAARRAVGDAATTIRSTCSRARRAAIAKVDTGDGRGHVLRHLRRDAVQPRRQAHGSGPRRSDRRRQPADAGARAHLSQQGTSRRWSARPSRAAATACCTWRSIRVMQQREVEIVNKLGLHARASAKLTQLAAKLPERRSASSRATGAR